jgi:signal transduction histidine kinase
MPRSPSAGIGLRVRLVLSFLVPVVVAGGLALILTTRNVTSFTRAQTEERLREQGPAVARLFARSAKKFFLEGDRQVNFSTDVQRVASAEVFYVPNPNAGFPYPGGNVAEWRGLPLDWRHIDTGGTETLEGVPPGRNERYTLVASGVFFTHDYAPDPAGTQDAIGAIVIARPLAALGPSQGFWTERLAPAFVAAGAAAALIGLLLGIRLVAPLRRLVTATGEIARGRFDVALDRRRRDEIGSLNRAFGDMADQLQGSREHERLFLMRVSHELRTPLTAIQGHVGALADGVVETPAGREDSYRVIAEEAVRLERLIRDLLDLAKLEGRRFALRREEVDVEALLDRCLAAHRETAREEGVVLDAAIGPVGSLLGDGDRILQIVSNVVANAIRWTPRGGTVSVTAAATPAAVTIAVADTGPGVPVERREDVFRPFFSQDSAGTGLGLAIASELAHAMGGTVAVDDAPAGGARFTVSFPRASV